MPTEGPNGINIDVTYLTDDKTECRRLLVKLKFMDKVYE